MGYFGGGEWRGVDCLGHSCEVEDDVNKSEKCEPGWVVRSCNAVFMDMSQIEGLPYFNRVCVDQKALLSRVSADKGSSGEFGKSDTVTSISHLQLK